MDLMEGLRRRAAERYPRVVFPEAQDPRTVEAALKAKSLGIAEPILVGDPFEIAASGLDLSAVRVINPATSEQVIDAYAEAYEKEQDFPKSAVTRHLTDPLNFAAIMLRTGDADAMVAGLVHATEDVILSSEMYVGLAAGVDIPSSYFVMDVPNWSGGENGLIVFADCAVVTNPSSSELASIALSSAASARALLGWEPRVALISFSTKGSATHADVDKVVAALEIVRAADPTLSIDGELQVDSAIVPAVSEKKINGDNVLKGCANVLVFPDLDAGNAAYKLVQRLAGAAAYGPVLQGFAKPVSDLSRGASVEDILGAITMVAAQA